MKNQYLNRIFKKIVCSPPPVYLSIVICFSYSSVCLHSSLRFINDSFHILKTKQLRFDFFHLYTALVFFSLFLPLFYFSFLRAGECVSVYVCVSVSVSQTK